MSLQSYEGKRHTKEVENDNLVPHGDDMAYFPFVYVHHFEQGWECKRGSNGELALLPVVKKFPNHPGSNGVQTGKKGAKYPDSKGAKVLLMEQGFTILDPQTYPGGYIVEYEGERGAIYLDPWSVPFRNGQKGFVAFGSAECIAAEDGLLWTQWQEHLLEHGYIKPPEPRHYDYRARVQENRVKKMSIYNMDIELNKAKLKEEMAKFEWLTERANSSVKQKVGKAKRRKTSPLDAE